MAPALRNGLQTVILQTPPPPVQLEEPPSQPVLSPVFSCYFFQKVLCILHRSMRGHASDATFSKPAANIRRPLSGLGGFIAAAKRCRERARFPADANFAKALEPPPRRGRSQPPRRRKYFSSRRADSPRRICAWRPSGRSPCIRLPPLPDIPASSCVQKLSRHGSCGR